jgi:hypothetical protein
VDRGGGARRGRGVSGKCGRFPTTHHDKMSLLPLSSPHPYQRINEMREGWGEREREREMKGKTRPSVAGSGFLQLVFFVRPGVLPPGNSLELVHRYPECLQRSVPRGD